MIKWSKIQGIDAQKNKIHAFRGFSSWSLRQTLSITGFSHSTRCNGFKIYCTKPLLIEKALAKEIDKNPEPSMRIENDGLPKVFWIK